MSSSATGVGMPICFLWAILLILTQKSSQKFGDVLGIGQPFKVLKVDKTLVDYYTKLSDFHAQFRAIGTNYNQVVKELRLHFSEKKAMALLYKLEQQTVELVKLSRRIVELSREMQEKWSQKSV